MEDKDKKKDGKGSIHLDIDLGLGNIFGGLKDIIETVSNLDTEGIKKEGKLHFNNEKISGMYGFTIKTIGDNISVQGFGNKVKEDKDGDIVADRVREPVVDVFDEGGYFNIIAEMPGIDEKDITVTVSGDIVQISAKSEKREYEKEVLLEKSVLPELEKKSYNNGILEIRLKKA